MTRLCMACLVLALFATFSCKKADSKKVPAVKAEAIAVTSPNESAEPQPTDEGILDTEAGKPEEERQIVVTVEDWQAQQAEKYPPLPEEDVQFIRSELARLAPENNFVYDEEANVILGNGLPEDGLDFENLVDKVVMEGRRERGKLNHEVLTKWCAGILAELQPRTTDQANANNPKRQNRQSSGGSGSSASKDRTPDPDKTAESPLVFAFSAIGEWKSIQEERPRITTYHNDDYFEFYQFMHDGQANVRFFREGKMALFKDYSFEYSPRNGELSLIDKNGQLSSILILKMKPEDNDTLYLEKNGEDSILVLDRIGTGYPTSENDDAPGFGDFAQ